MSVFFGFPVAVMGFILFVYGKRKEEKEQQAEEGPKTTTVRERTEKAVNMAIVSVGIVALGLILAVVGVAQYWQAVSMPGLQLDLDADSSSNYIGGFVLVCFVSYSSVVISLVPPIFFKWDRHQILHSL